MPLASSQLYFNHLQLETPSASKYQEVYLQSAIAAKPFRSNFPWAGRLQGAFAIGIAAEPPTNAADRPAIAAEILQLQPRFCNCSRNSAIAAERCSAAIPDCKCTLQALRPREGWGSEWLGCNFRLQMHSAVSPPTRVLPRQAANAAESRAQRLA